MELNIILSLRISCTHNCRCLFASLPNFLVFTPFLYIIVKPKFHLCYLCTQKLITSMRKSQVNLSLSTQVITTFESANYVLFLFLKVYIYWDLHGVFSILYQQKYYSTIIPPSYIGQMYLLIYVMNI